MGERGPPSPTVSHIICLLRNSLPLEEKCVSVHYDPDRFARKSNLTQEEEIASQWRRRCRQNARLFDASKFRYAGLRWTEAGGPQVHLGLTSYRDHIGTNCSGGASLLQEAGAAVHCDRQAFLADPLGVGALLLTADNRLVLVRRALWTAEYPGRVDRPGGHAEPHQLAKGDGGSTHEAVLRELFESVRRELRDELGVPMQHLSRAYLMAALRDMDMAGRPTLEFIVRCSLPSSELERLYNEGKHAEADESLGILFLTSDELFSCRAVFRVPDLADVSHQWPEAEYVAGHDPANVGGEVAEADRAPETDRGREQYAPQHDGAEADRTPEADRGREQCAPQHEGAEADRAAEADRGREQYAPQHEGAAASGDVAGQNCGRGGTADAAAAPAQRQPARGRQQASKKRRRNRADRREARTATSRPSVAAAVERSVVGADDSRAESAPSDVPDTSADAAVTSGGATVTSADTAVTSVGAGVTSVGAAVTSVDTAVTSGGATVTSADAAVTSADAAVTSVDTAVTSGGAAMTSADAVVTSGGATVTLGDAAMTSADAVVTSTAGRETPTARQCRTDTAEQCRTDTDECRTDADELVVVSTNGVILLRAAGEVTEATMPTMMPTTMPADRQIETLAEVSNTNPEAAVGDPAPEKTPEELDREKKAKLWEEMTPSCRASLVLFRQMTLKGFVFQF